MTWKSYRLPRAVSSTLQGFVVQDFEARNAGGLSKSALQCWLSAGFTAFHLGNRLHKSRRSLEFRDIAILKEFLKNRWFGKMAVYRTDVSRTDKNLLTFFGHVYVRVLPNYS